MALPSLPNELLSPMNELTIPEGFENFILSCKAVYQAGQTLLEEDNTLRRQHTFFKYGGSGSFSDTKLVPTLSSLSFELCTIHGIAIFIVHADLKKDSKPELRLDTDSINILTEYVHVLPNSKHCSRIHLPAGR
jgi:hypothetical protein